MNYLAHAYLSFNHPQLLVGNLISDFVKGKQKFEYEAGIQKGITLHRAIDQFTDDHAASKEAKKYFKADYGLYSAAFVDIVYDHFLAIDHNEFTASSLFDFSRQTYQAMDDYVSVFPKKFQDVYPYMKMYNWLYNYQYLWSIKRSFNGLVYRAKYLTESEKAFAIFEENYSSLQQCYQHFFPEVKDFAYKLFQSVT